jgi:hypothetical protein
MSKTIRIHDMVADEIGRLLAEEGVHLTVDELVALAEFIEEVESDEDNSAVLEMLCPLRAAA